MELQKDYKPVHMRPNHPLPDEILQMPRNETVCQYCGVSYLIHNEIKLLEDRLHAAELELDKYRGMEKREEELRQQLQFTTNSLAENESRFQSCCQDLEGKTAELSSLHETVAHLQSKLRLKDDNYQENLLSLSEKLKSDKQILEVVRNETQVTLTRLSKDSEISVTCIADAAIMCVKDIKAESQRQRDLLNVKDAEIAELKNLHDKLEDSAAQLEVANQQSQQLTTELQKSKDKLRRQNSEINELELKLKNQSQLSEQMIASYKSELAKKEASVAALQSDIASLSANYSQQQQQMEDDIRSKCAAAECRTEGVQSALDEALAELKRLHSEREMMILAHQKQIEQLRESFRQKLLEAESWPAKVEEAVRNEKKKHAVELQELENRLKTSFVQELDAVKQLHQHQKDHLLAEAQTTETTLKNQLNNAVQQSKVEAMRLGERLKQTEETLTDLRSTTEREETILKTSVDNLKRQLGQAETQMQQHIGEMQSEIESLQSRLHDAETTEQMLQAKLRSAERQVEVLRETVRQECEERSELTEALELAKKELIVLKRPPSGYGTTKGSDITKKIPAVTAGRQGSAGGASDTASVDSLPPLVQDLSARNAAIKPQQRTSVDTSLTNIHLNLDNTYVKSSGRVQPADTVAAADRTATGRGLASRRKHQ